MSTPHRMLHRIEHPGQGRYLTFSCYQRLPLLNNPLIKDAFIDRLAMVRNTLNFPLYAYVVMPEHVHLLLSTGNPQLTVTRILNALKSQFGQQVIRRWRHLRATTLTEKITDPQGISHFWQTGGGYDRNIVSDSEWLEKINYIHENPVQRGLVKIAVEWQWSSARWYAGDHTGPKIDPWQ